MQFEGLSPMKKKAKPIKSKSKSKPNRGVIL